MYLCYPWGFFPDLRWLFIGLDGDKLDLLCDIYLEKPTCNKLLFNIYFNNNNLTFLQSYFNKNFWRRKESPKACSTPLQHGEQWPADGSLAQKSSFTRVLWDLLVYQRRSGNHSDPFLCKALKTKQSISYSPTDAKTENLSVCTPGRKTIYYSNPHLVSVSRIRPLLARSTCTLCSLFGTRKHPLPSRIIPIPA